MYMYIMCCGDHIPLCHSVYHCQGSAVQCFALVLPSVMERDESLLLWCVWPQTNIIVAAYGHFKKGQRTRSHQIRVTTGHHRSYI